MKPQRESLHPRAQGSLSELPARTSHPWKLLLPDLCPFSFSWPGLRDGCRGAEPGLSHRTEELILPKPRLMPAAGLQLGPSSCIGPGLKGLACPRFCATRGQSRPMTSRCISEKSCPALEPPWHELRLCCPACNSTPASAPIRQSVSRNPPTLPACPVFVVKSQGAGP